MYEDIKSVVDLAEAGDGIVTCDIRNGFFHIKVHQDDTQYLGFKYKSLYYMWLVLPLDFLVRHSFLAKLLERWFNGSEHNSYGLVVMWTTLFYLIRIIKLIALALF